MRGLPKYVISKYVISIHGENWEPLTYTNSRFHEKFHEQVLENRWIPITAWPFDYAPDNSDWWLFGVVLIPSLQVQTRRQLTRPQKDNFGVVSEICNRQQNAYLIG